MSDSKSYPAKSALSEPKPVPVSVEPSAPSVPEMFNVPQHVSVFVLVPWDGLEQRAVLAQLDDACLKYFATPPAVHHELKIARLPFGSQLFVAHCTQSRARRDDGTFGPVSQLHIGGPIDLKQYTTRSGDGYTWDTNMGAIVDAVTKVCKHNNGRVWLGGLSGDAQADQKVLKLSAC